MGAAMFMMAMGLSGEDDVRAILYDSMVGSTRFRFIPVGRWMEDDTLAFEG